jgi:hypothetical protein
VTSQHTIELRARSGTVTLTGRLTAFLYDLMRDHLTPGAVEKIVQESTDIEVVYTNGWLARYAEDLAHRLQPPIVKPSADVTPEDRTYAVRAEQRAEERRYRQEQIRRLQAEEDAEGEE